MTFHQCEVKTKFNVGQTVYFMVGSSVKKTTIETIDIKVFQDTTGTERIVEFTNCFVQYNLKGSILSLTEDKLFKTKSDAINSLEVEEV
jgi:hypothetical protein